MLDSIARGDLPVDFSAYAAAAHRVASGGTLFQPAEVAQSIWLGGHLAFVTGDPGHLVDAPPPYFYPPSLAALLAATGIGPAGFTAVVALAVAGAGGMLWRLGAGAWPALLGVASLDVTASHLGGNVEMILLALAIAAFGLLWRGHGALAAVPAAAAMLAKPYYALLFLGLAALVARARPDLRRALALAVAGAALLCGAEMLRWDPALRAEWLADVTRGVERTWMALPEDQRTPFTHYNRTPWQVIGWPALVLWAGALGGAVWAVRPGARAIAVLAAGLALFHLGRPVAWTLPFLDAVVLAAAWPALGRWRWALLAAVLAVWLSHWAAFALFLAQAGGWLVTFQTEQVPWETVLLLPAAAALAVWACARPAGDATSPVREGT